MLTYVLAKDGTPLMPTYNIKKVRRMLKSGRAVIAGHNPGFTIRLTYELPKQEAPHTQDTEFCMDTGKEHIGVSIKSEKHEFVHAQYDNLPDEKARHDNARRSRRNRRNRKRYRQPRFNNRTAAKKNGWLVPTVRHAKENHIHLYTRYKTVLPIISTFIEVGQFDTQALEAAEKGLSLPKGTDYQKGPRYETDTLREAVFQRDGYKCQVCGKAPFDKDGGKGHPLILHVHHAFFWKGDHTDRLSGLVAVCGRCHTPSNHKEGGKLYGWTPKTGAKNMSGASFMNQVRWKLYEELKALCEKDSTGLHLTYGVTTKRERHSRRITKTHANDAYCMGQFRPKHKAKQQHFRKRRRNERALQKFYDKKVIDIRTNKTVKGAELGCNRTNRREPRNNDRNLRPYRGRTVSKGRVSTKRSRSTIPTGSVVRYKGKRYITAGTQHYGEYVTVKGGKPLKVSCIKVIQYAGGWIQAE